LLLLLFAWWVVLTWQRASIDIVAVPISLKEGRGQRRCRRYSCGADMADNPHTRLPPTNTHWAGTTCIQGGNRRHAPHTDACPVGSILREVEWGEIAVAFLAVTFLARNPHPSVRGGAVIVVVVIRMVGGADVAEGQHRHCRRPHIPERREGPASLSSLFVWR